MYGGVWECVGACWIVCDHEILCGYVWEYVGACEIVWERVRACGRVWQRIQMATRVCAGPVGNKLKSAVGSCLRSNITM